MRRILLLLALTVLGCSREQEFTSVDDILRPYVQEFYSHFPYSEIYNITVKFGDIVAGGQCVKTNDSHHVTVIINKDSFDRKWCDEQKRGVIFHELGHCVLNKEHAAPVAIDYMIPQVSSCAFYTENKAALIQKMFTF